MMKLMTLIIGMVVTAQGFSTTTLPDPQDPTQIELPVEDNTLELVVDEWQIVPGSDLAVRFVEVDDSRCPSDVLCIWAGKVTVKVEYALKPASHKEVPIVIEKEMELKDYIFADDMIVTLEAVNPYPSMANGPITIEDYTVVMSYEKAFVE